MRILANDGLDKEAVQEIKNKGWELFLEKIPEDKISHFCNHNKIDVIIVRSATKLSKKVIEELNHTKYIIRAGIGTDNIDLDSAKAKNIKVLTTPEASVNSVAELTISLIFAALRNIKYAFTQMPLQGSKKFTLLKNELSKGEEAYGKTIGIIGAGKIGKKVAEKTLLLGLHPLFYDPYVYEISLLINFLDYKVVKVFKTISLAELIKLSDIISIHANYPRENGPIITKKEIEQMKDGVIIINTARGYCVNENDIIEGLNSGKIKAYCVDVFEGEPTPKAELLAHPNVFATPHIGASTIQAQRKIGKEIVNMLLNLNV